MLGVDCGIGGRDSSSEAPNDDVGLNALIPLNPVVCGFNGGENVIDGVVAPVTLDVAPVG